MTEETKQPESKAEEQALVQTNNEALDAIKAEIAAETEAEESGEVQEESKPEEKPEVKAEEQEEPEAPEEEEVAEEKPKKKNSARERIKELTDKVKAKESEAERIARENEELKAFIKQKLEPKQEEEKEEEFLDPEAQKWTKQEIAKLKQEIEQKDFISAVAREDALNEAKDETWKLKKEVVLNWEASDLIARGRASNEKEAYQMAAQSIAEDLQRIYQKRGSVADYINRRAGEVIKRFPKKDTKDTSTQGVDMVKLDNLRKAAGAPTNKVASPDATTGADLMAKIKSELAAEKKKANSSVW